MANHKINRILLKGSLPHLTITTKRDKIGAPLCLRCASSARSFAASVSTAEDDGALEVDDDEDEDEDADEAEDDDEAEAVADAPLAAVVDDDEEDEDAGAPDVDERGPRFDCSNTSFSANGKY